MIHIPSRNPDARQGPLVTYVISTYNRPRYLREAIASALAQEHRNLQVLVVRDGGEPVKEVIDSFDDDRLEFIDRDENRGLSYSYNQAMQHIRGKYVAYLGDDDVHYPNHIRRLVETLEGDTDCQAAYSDLVCAVCAVGESGDRTVLGKGVVVSRDYDRAFMLQYNPAPGGATMHRTDLFERTGPFNEDITVLIDWDINRRIAHFTDFQHITDVTGEFYTQINKDGSDRISDKQRRDRDGFSDRCRSILWSRPPKPWKCFKDTAIVYLPAKIDAKRLQTVGNMLGRTVMPHLLYIPAPEHELRKLGLEQPTVRLVSTPSGADDGARLDTVLKRTDADLVAIVPDCHPVAHPLWLGNSALPLIRSDRRGEAVLIAGSGSNEHDRAAVLWADDLRRARKKYRSPVIWRSTYQAGIRLRAPGPDERPMPMDDSITQADVLAKAGDYVGCAEAYLDIAGEGGNRLLLDSRAAWAYWNDERHDEDALAIIREVNRNRPTIDSVLAEAKFLNRMGRAAEAAGLYEKAIDFLQPYEVSRGAPTL